ncbi:hypothetical protein MP228_008109 [Amoeboaphelidium protococcarum]|nr:hypothetical protein MP228_008109 [Amoeboaphelidium protococcarum]
MIPTSPPYDAQRGHSTTVAELHYGITNVDVAGIGNSALQSFFVASRRWQVLPGAATEASIFLPSAVTFTSSRVNLLAAPRTMMAVTSTRLWYNKIDSLSGTQKSLGRFFFSALDSLHTSFQAG